MSAYTTTAVSFLSDLDAAKAYVLSRSAADINGIIDEMAKQWTVSSQPLDMYTMLRRDEGSLQAHALCCKMYGTSLALYVRETGRREWSFITNEGDSEEFYDIESDVQAIAYLLARFW